MGRVTKYGLKISNRKAETLENMANSAKSMKEGIDSFISTSNNVLVGGGFDALRAKLLLYSEIYGLLAQMCSTTQNNFVSVNNSMYNFMEDYNSLDDKNIDTIKGKISNIRSEIDYLDSLKIDALKVLINTNRDWYENQLYYLNKELDKLEELQPTDNTLYGKLGKTVGDINKFKKYVNDLKVTKIN